MKNMPKIEDKINAILSQVRPSLQMDGGDVELKSFKGGIVELKIKGACHGCPMAQVTFGQGVGELLKQKIPAIKEVRYN